MSEGQEVFSWCLACGCGCLGILIRERGYAENLPIGASKILSSVFGGMVNARMPRRSDSVL